MLGPQLGPNHHIFTLGYSNGNMAVRRDPKNRGVRVSNVQFLSFFQPFKRIFDRNLIVEKVTRATGCTKCESKCLRISMKEVKKGIQDHT